MVNSGSTFDRSVPLADGARIPLLGFGTWQLRDDEARQATGWALQAGYRHIDTATGYRNQSEVGAAIRDSGLSRDELFVTTKLPPDHAGRVQQTLQESLRQLGLQRLDLWLIHWPPGGTAGVDSWREFVAAREAGLTTSIGVSNYSLDQLDELTSATGVTPAVNQIKWSPAVFDQAVLDGHRERGVVLEGYSPFRSANLSNPALTEIASRHGKTPAQVIVRWHLQHEIVVIPKSSQQERIVSNADVGDFTLDSDEMAIIDGLADPA